MSFQPSFPEHPILPVPSEAALEAMGVERAVAFLREREEALARESSDPLHHGWEPDIWQVCDALLGLPWVDADRGAVIRAALGFEKPVRSLLLMGGNRASKTEWAAKRCMQLLLHFPKVRVAPYHETGPRSVEEHHPLFMKYMPPGVKAVFDEGKQIRSGVEYVTYNQKNGFTDGKFVMKNGSECVFRNYEQKASAAEGGNLKMVWDDELVPAELAKTQEFRTATLGGWCLFTFTPTQGYTPTVAMFLEGATTVLESPAFLLPKDGQPWDEESALVCERFGVEYGKFVVKRPRVAEGRAFQMMPRVMRCANARRAVVFFYTSDNPFGNPREVLDIVRGGTEGFIKERFYGLPTKAWSARFSVQDDVHVVRPDQVPEAGSNFMCCDPASKRNWFMLWARATPDGSVYVYREWPSQVAPVPGVGVLGAWAEFHGKKVDGVPGPAQTSLNFGRKKYKEEIARLEGWADYDRHSGKDGEEHDVKYWRAESGARERVVRRIMDSRGAKFGTLKDEETRTLSDEMEEIGLWFDMASGEDIEGGVQTIVDRLYYNREQASRDGGVTFMNRPTLYVSSDCKNLLYALKTWTGVDGNKGATKDPIDTLRYLLLAEPCYYGEVSGGGSGKSFYY